MLLLTTCFPKAEPSRLAKPEPPCPHSWGRLVACPMAALAAAEATALGPKICLTRLVDLAVDLTSEVPAKTVTLRKIAKIARRRIAILLLPIHPLRCTWFSNVTRSLETQGLIKGGSNRQKFLQGAVGKNGPVANREYLPPRI